MGKRAFIPAWDGVTPVEGLTMVAPAPQPKAVPAATPVVEAATPVAAPEAAAPAAEPATPVATAAPEPVAATPEAAPANGISLDQLQAFAAVLLVRRMREMREEEQKQ